MTLRINTAGRDARASNFSALFNSGFFEIRTGPQPVTADTAASGTLLASIPLPNPAFGSPSSGTVNKAGTWSVASVASGDAGWGRLRNAADTIRLDGSVGVLDEDFIIDNVTIQAPGIVTVISASLTEPASEE